MREVVTAVFLLIGAVFTFLAALGLLRLPDLFCRMQATAKSATAGAGAMLIALAIHFGDLGVASRALATLAFIFLTTPVAAQMIGRAAYLAGVPLWEGTVRDELRDREGGPLEGPPPPGPRLE